MNNGAAPGPSGLSMDTLSLLCSNDNCLTGLTWIISDMINGYLPDNTKQYLLSSQLIGIENDRRGGLLNMTSGRQWIN